MPEESAPAKEKESDYLTLYLQDMEDSDNMIYLAVCLLYRALRLPLPPSNLGSWGFTFTPGRKVYTFRLTPQQAQCVYAILGEAYDLEVKADKIRQLRQNLWQDVAKAAPSLYKLIRPTAGKRTDPPSVAALTTAPRKT